MNLKEENINNLLKYLKNKDIERYSSLCESLGLRK